MNGSPALWSLAEALEVVPAPPDPQMAALLREWWTRPRRFGCRRASREAVWFVVAPDERVWCHQCAVTRAEVERRCLYCGDQVADDVALAAYEMRSEVRVMGRIHPEHFNQEETR